MRGWRIGGGAVLLLAMALAGSGCVSARAYFSDRWADAKDVFTATAGVGAGVKARVGPIQYGLFGNMDCWGLQGGYVGADAVGTNIVLPLPIPVEDSGKFWGFFGGIELFQFEPGQDKRGKAYEAISRYVVFTYLSEKAHFYTQIEVAAGVGGTLRLGFNPGELLDFLLGWTNLDIYGDDLAARKEREESEKKPLAPPAPPAAPAPPAPKQPGAKP